MIEQNVLQFGNFTLKSGRESPYFFNLGSISSGTGLATLGRLYAEKLLQLNLEFDVLFGPAYKGIPLATTTAIALSEHDMDVAAAFNRKEPKDHGEGGSLVGAAMTGKQVVLIDDVVTDGQQKRESAELIYSQGGSLKLVLVALDREEFDYSGKTTAIEALAQEISTPVVSVATLTDVVGVLESTPKWRSELSRVNEYRGQHCKQ